MIMMLSATALQAQNIELEISENKDVETIKDTAEIDNRRNADIDEVVISGTMKAVRRLETPVPVEVYSPTFLKKNPTPNVFEALQNVNGVRPQINCSVCNTGDIHINGLEGS